ncbi:MAG TPA: protein kinase [Kofleriaceae bacterium]|nr:protein kinase [Kofleriaceae bacterium]
MAGAKGEDELARTATAPGSPEGSVAPALDLGSTLGRYRLERSLGGGAMGVVHAAFDPDLERRVALKVLRVSDGSEEARQRLLREARALARLAHPNVVTVHEVGTAGGRDYVAMELVEGESLADWLRGGPRTREEIVAAFVAAGRGLAAAHAAGLVHRDFKPHNVLRRGDGRIVVTDFGLARYSDAAQPASWKPQADGSMKPAVLTQTGSLLGTPAYMAPEQWSGGTIGAAADQFAFCVALWEALAGERPFRGDTLDALKAEVARGPASLDVSKLPRRLRSVLRRGLEPDPAERWPSMNALLAALVRGERRPKLALAAVGTMVVTAGALFVALGRSGGVGGECAAPVLDPAAVWSSPRAATLAANGQAPGARALALDLARWTDTRARVCRADAAARPARLACLDGVLAQDDALARELASVQGAPHADAGALLVDPAACEAPRAPRLVSAMSPERLAAIDAFLVNGVAPVPLAGAQADALVARTASDPCAAALARIIASTARHTTIERTRDLAEADGAAQRCGDDRLIAQAALASARAALDMNEPDLTPKLERADAAAEAVMQPDLRAAFDELRAMLAERADHLDDALTRYEAARDGFAARGRTREALRASMRVEELREVRGRADELVAVAGHLAAWRAEAVAALGADDPVVRELDTAAAWWQFSNGDVAGAHARFLANARQLPLDHAVHASGRVVDDHGAPVAGATVVAAHDVTADELGILPDPAQRATTSRADGTFDLPEAVSSGIVVAELGDRRSPPQHTGEGLVLALAATSRVEGRVDLRGAARTNVTVAIRDPSQAIGELTVIAPVHADGTFATAGVPRGKLIVHVQLSRVRAALLSGTPVTVTDPVVTGLALAVPSSSRVVHVVVRSTVGIALKRAEVIVMPGDIRSSNVAELQRTIQGFEQRSALRIEGEHAPASVLAVAKPGDVYATVSDAPEGRASACAIGMPGEVTDPDLDQKIPMHLDKIEVRCVPLDEHAQVVLVEVPPWPRLD